jgi:transposase
MAARAGQPGASPCSSLDYHIEIHDFLYSVPRALICAEVEVCVTARTVGVFHRGQRVADHQRRCMGRKHGTDPDHMPSSHRRYAEWTPDRFRRWAGKIGPNTEGLISAALASPPHPEQGFRTCLAQLQGRRRPGRPQARRCVVRGQPPRHPVRSRQSARSRLLLLRGNSSCSLIRHSTN